MSDIRMVDLQKQYLRIKPEIDSAIQEVINSSAFINGPQVKTFAKNLEDYLGVKHVIPCANGTDALQIALMSLNLQPGDEVITPDFTFIATAEVIALLGLKPVMVDIDAKWFTLDIKKLEAAITPRTRAIIPVHLYGTCANMDEILKLAKQHQIYVIEDAAQALGASYCTDKLNGKAGTLGDIGCTSFFPSKNLGCFGDGGSIMTQNDELAEKIRCIANHGAKVKYYHDEVGVNSRLDTLQAAILNVKLKYLDEYAQARRAAAAVYTELLSDIQEVTLPETPEYSDHVFHQFTLKVSRNRDELRSFLANEGIPTMIYYPVPMHAQKAFEAHGDFPVSDSLAKTVISLPMHTELTREQQVVICNKIRKFYS